MLPIALDLSHLHIVLVGSGPQLFRRLGVLHEEGAKRITVFSDDPLPTSPEEQGWQEGYAVIPRLPESHEIRQASVLMVVGLDDQKSAVLSSIARLQGILVNVEDKPELCDFYFTSFIKRGRLLLSVSSSGASPVLAQEVKAALGELFGPEWTGYVEEVAAARQQWRKEGLSITAVAEKSRAFIRDKGWLQQVSGSRFQVSENASLKPQTSNLKPHHSEPA